MPVEVLVPPLGATVDTLTLVTWYKQEGDAVEKDEPLFAVETDKATLDVEAPATGILRRITAEPGAEVVSLSRIAFILSPGEPEPSVEAESPLAGGPVPTPAEPIGAATGRKTQNSPAGRTLISPRAKKLAETRSLEWQTLEGTGPEGAIVERDVVLAVGAAQQKDDEVAETIPVTGIRAVIASRMAASAAATAPVTLTTEADATALVEWRKKLIAKGVAASYNDLLLFILARALREHPRVNATLDGDVIKVWRRVNIGLAVDAQDGLRVPVLKDVDQLGLEDIVNKTGSLVESVRDSRIRPEEMRGATFTLTNLGMFGIDAFTPAINLPECAILGVGRIKPQATVVGNGIAIRQKMWLSLTFDHRLVDGAPAARFLQCVGRFIETAGAVDA